MACALLFRVVSLVWLTGTVQSALKAVHLFPLGQTSITYDVKRMSHQPSALSQTCPLLAQSSKFQYASFFYDGSPLSIASFTLTGTLYRSAQFSFAFWIQPDSVDGVFFEYRTATESSGTISRVKGELVNGAVKMTYGGDGGDYGSMTSSETLSAGAWAEVIMSGSKSLGKTTMVINGIYAEESLDSPINGFMYPGTWRIGESWTGSSFFLGKMNCAALYFTVIDKTNMGYYTPSCQVNQGSTATGWVPPITGVPNCSVIVPGAYQEPLHLWPLTAQSLGYDVTTLTPSLHPGNDSKCPQLDDDSKFSGSTSWRLNGSNGQQLELTLCTEVYSFSIAMYIWSYTADSVLLEYDAESSPASSADKISHVIVRLVDEYLHVEFQDEANTTLCNVTSGNHYSLQSWKWMALEWDYGRGELTLTVDISHTVHQLPALKRWRLTTPGVVKVGGTESDHWLTRWPEPFLGKVTCLAMYGQTLDDHRSEYEDSCVPADGWPNTPSVPACQATQADQYSHPVHLWPLTNDTLGYDVMGHQDAVTPSLSTTGNCPVFRQFPFPPFPAMAFENNPPDVILRIPSSTPYVSFTIGMFVTADVFQGLLLEYVMDDVSVSGDVIRHVTLEILPDKSLQVNMTIQDGTPIPHLTTSHHLDQHPTGILLAWDLVHGVRVSIDTHLDASPAGSFHRLPLGTPGSLQVAGRAPPGGGWGGRFRGLVSCVAFFSRAIDKNHADEFETECSSVPLPVPPLFVATTCTNEPEPVIPKYVWPLTNVTMATEALSGMPPVSEASTSSCHRLEDSASTLTGHHQRQLYFDGSLSSGLELPVNESLFRDDFSLVLFLKPELPAEGQILDYTANNSATLATPTSTTTTTTSSVNGTRISRIQVSFGASGGGDVEVSVWSDSEGSATSSGEGPVLCSHLLLSGVLQDGSWTLLRIGRTSSSGTMQVAINGTEWGGSGACISDPAPATHTWLGRLSLGGRSLYGSAGYRGALGCLMLFSVSMETQETLQLLEQCRLYNTSSADNAACNQETPTRIKGFRLVDRNIWPSSAVRPPIKSSPTRTRLACAMECLQTSLCRSYVVEISMTSIYDCSLYDYVTKLALEPTAGSHYYEIKN